jgi:hypothetical protein
VAGGNANWLQQHTVNGTLRWEPWNIGQVTLNGYYDRVFGAITPYSDVTGPTGDTDNVTLNVNDPTTLVYTGANLKGEFELAGLRTTVTPIVSFDSRTTIATGDADFSPIEYLRVSGTSSFHTATGELRFDTKYNDRLSSLVGVFRDRNIYSIQGVTTVALSLQEPSSQRIATDVFAIYGTGFWNISKKHGVHRRPALRPPDCRGHRFRRLRSGPGRLRRVRATCDPGQALESRGDDLRLGGARLPRRRYQSARLPQPDVSRRLGVDL